MGVKLSACTITKNEELNIGRSIDSYKDYVDEIIIVDTGSTDKTVEIAKSKGAKVFNFEWKNDFSAAKNFALDNATGEWILFLDADEWFDGDSAKNMQKAIEKSVSENYKSVACRMANFYNETDIMETISTIRIFKREDNIRFCRAIHETLFDLSKDTALPGLYSELLLINHSGYMKVLLDKKAKRNKILLDRNFALGNMAPIDYFYGMRENMKENINVCEYFFKLIENTPNYDDLVSSYNINTSVEEIKIRVTNMLPNKYNFDYRAKLLEEVQEKYKNNPMFKFYEYLLFETVDKKRAIKALQDAVEFDKTFEDENIATSNPFYGKKSEVYSALGEYYIFVNDKIKALDFFTKAIKEDYTNLAAFRGILYTVSSEKSEDIIIFIKSIYDIDNREVEKFIVDALRLTEFSEVFLYYFVDYYKKYEEVDRAFFTSRLLTGKFEEIADKYIKVYKESKDDRALVLVAAALATGNCKEKFLASLEAFNTGYLKILTAYFEDNKVESLTELEYKNIFEIVQEIAYIAPDDVIKKIINLCPNIKGRLEFDILNYYYSQHSYNYILKWINYFENDGEVENNLSVYLNFLKTSIYFRTNDFEKIPECLDKVIYNGFLNQEIVFICEALEADDDKLKEYFELFYDMIFAKKSMPYDKVDDISNESLRFMTIDKFNEYLQDKKILLFNEQIKLFFDFAEKAKAQKAYVLAEKYYRILLKYGNMKDKCYFALGDIYNRFEKPELSYYCYENAFIENFTLANDILPANHINKNYIFSKKEEVNIDKCPVCGGNSKLAKTYINLESEQLSYNEPVILKYKVCDKCGHMFVSNDIANKIYWEDEANEAVDSSKIMTAYDILENICEITDKRGILSSSDNKEFNLAAENYGFTVKTELSNEKFDVIFIDDCLTKTYDIEGMLKKYSDKLSFDGIIVAEFFDKDNAFSKLADKPLWVKSKVKNIFSKESVNTLFNKFGLHILQTNIDKNCLGKVVVIASK